MSMRSLGDYVKATVSLRESGRFDKKLSWKQVAKTAIRGKGVFFKPHIEQIADDVLAELFHTGVITRKPQRKTERYFREPVRVLSSDEKLIEALATRFLKDRAVARQKSGAKSDPVRDARFLERDIRYFLGKIGYEHPVDVGALAKCVRSRSAKKAAETRRVRAKAKRAREQMDAKHAQQLSLF